MQVESGAQLFSRLKTRPSLHGINPHLFLQEGPFPNQVIEIAGDMNSGKTYFLTDLIAKCLLPCKYQGKNCGVVFVNTDHHFELFKLLSIMEKYVKNADNTLSKTHVENVIMEALKQLIVLNCYDDHQLSLTFSNLEKILSDNLHIGLIAVDSICAYYWCERLISGIISMNKYLHGKVSALQNVVKENNVVLVYTRPSNFSGNLNAADVRCDEVSIGKVTYFITLSKNAESLFTAEVVTCEGTKLCNFKIVNSIILYEV